MKTGKARDLGNYDGLDISHTGLAALVDKESNNLIFYDIKTGRRRDTGVQIKGYGTFFNNDGTALFISNDMGIDVISIPH